MNAQNSRALPEAVNRASVAQPPDPIFAAIERHRRVFAIYEAASSVSGRIVPGSPNYAPAELRAGRACGAERIAWTELLETVPTTRAGLEMFAEHLRIVASTFDHETEDEAAFKRGFEALHSAIFALSEVNAA